MTTVEFEGRTYEFDPGITKDEIFAFLDKPSRAAQQPSPPARVPGAAGMLNWAARNPQEALDTLGTGLGATAGMAAPGGPAVQIPAAGAGAATGKQVARKIGQWARFAGATEPTGGELTLDALMGGAGPAIGAVARPAARALTGITDDMAKTVLPAHNKIAEHTLAAESAKAAGKGSTDDIFKGYAEAISKINRGESTKLSGELKAKIAELSKEAAKGAATEVPRRLGDMSAIVMGIAHGDLTSAALLFGAGAMGSPARVEIAKRILGDRTALKWIVDRTSKGVTPARLLTSLSGLAAVEGITADARHAIRELQGERKPDTLRPSTLRGGKAEGEGPPRSARFRESRAMRDDRDALERMMEGDG